jgi:hypothetical protein
MAALQGLTRRCHCFMQHNQYLRFRFHPKYTVNGIGKKQESDLPNKTTKSIPSNHFSVITITYI